MTRTLALSCSCGGTTTVHVEEEQATAITECACGKTLFWSDSLPDPPTLGISVSDSSEAKDKFGG